MFNTMGLKPKQQQQNRYSEHVVCTLMCALQKLGLCMCRQIAKIKRKVCEKAQSFADVNMNISTE